MGKFGILCFRTKAMHVTNRRSVAMRISLTELRDESLLAQEDQALFEGEYPGRIALTTGPAPGAPSRTP